MDQDPYTYEQDTRLPELVFQYPTCSHCGEEVQIEDGYPSCAECLVQWDSMDDGALGAPDLNIDGTDVECGKPADVPGSEYDLDGQHYVLGAPRPCVLPSGHTSTHHHPYTVTSTPL